MATGVPSSQRSGVVSQSTFYELLKQVESRVGVLERASRLRSASIGGGGLTFYDNGAIYFLGEAGDATPGLIAPIPLQNGLTINPPFDGGVTEQSLNHLVIFGLLDGEPDNDRAALVSTGPVSLDQVDLSGNVIGTIALASNNTVVLDGTSVTAKIDPTIGIFSVEGMRTSGAAANLVIDAGSGDIRRSVSGLKYKENIEPAVIDPDDVLQLAAKTFTVKGDTSGTRYTGVIAEDLDALASLRQFVVYDSEGVPDSVNYDRLALPVLELVKHLKLLLDTISLRVDVLSQTVSAQQAHIDALTAQNAAQQQAIDDLTARMEAMGR